MSGCSCVLDSVQQADDHPFELLPTPTPKKRDNSDDIIDWINGSHTKINVPFVDHQNGTFVLTHDGMSCNYYSPFLCQ